MSKADSLPLTPSQTVGPFFTLGLFPNARESGLKPLIGDAVGGEGEPISISGQVFDGGGKPVPDALLEFAQADGDGRIAGGDLPRFARVHTSFDGQFIFHSVRPGALRAGEAPYISFAIFMRGMLLHAFSRIYFGDENSNRDDPVFGSLPESRRNTLLASRVKDADHASYVFDIHMQGERETVFFTHQGGIVSAMQGEAQTESSTHQGAT